MVREAFLTKTQNGRYSYDAEDVNEIEAPTLDEWLGNAAGGITVEPAPELNDLIEDRNGGTAFRMFDQSAALGFETNYLIAWVDVAQ